jgi:hypothetical protein
LLAGSDVVVEVGDDSAGVVGDVGEVSDSDIARPNPSSIVLVVTLTRVSELTETTVVGLVSVCVNVSELGGVTTTVVLVTVTLSVGEV